jgi:hypothetical protein
MYLNIYQDFSKTAKLNLHEELEKVTPDAKATLYHESYYYQEVLLADLFKSIPSYMPILIVFSIVIAVWSLGISLLRKKKVILK